MGPQEEEAPCVLLAHTSTPLVVSNKSRLLTLDMCVKGIATPLRALLDTGASNNFVRSGALISLGVPLDGGVPSTSKLIVRLATGSTIEVPKRTILLNLTCGTFVAEDEFIVLDLDDKFDIILGMPWSARHQPEIDWEHQSITSISQHKTVAEETVFWVHVSTDIPSTLVVSNDSESDGPDIARGDVPLDDVGLYNQRTKIHHDGDGSVVIGDNTEVSVGNQLRGILKKESSHFAVNSRMEGSPPRLSFGHSTVYECLQTHYDDNGSVDDPLVDTEDSAGIQEVDAALTPSVASKARCHKKNPRQKGVLRERITKSCDQHNGDVESSAEDSDQVHAFETLNVTHITENGGIVRSLSLVNPPRSAAELVGLSAMSLKRFMSDLRRDEIEQICLIVNNDDQGSDEIGSD